LIGHDPFPDRIPVIAGTGEIADRPKDVTQALEPVALMAEAARLADAEAKGLLREVDSIDIVGLVSWRYSNTAALLCEKLGVSRGAPSMAPSAAKAPSAISTKPRAALRAASPPSASLQAAKPSTRSTTPSAPTSNFHGRPMRWTRQSFSGQPIMSTLSR
jgi:hypothetical protein